MNILKITKTNRNWHEIILWWEIRRVPYNLFLYFAAVLSFYISYVTIPLIYLVIGFALNAIYTLGWIIELVFVRQIQNESKKTTILATHLFRIWLCQRFLFLELQFYFF